MHGSGMGFAFCVALVGCGGTVDDQRSAPSGSSAAGSSGEPVGGDGGASGAIGSGGRSPELTSGGASSGRGGAGGGADNAGGMPGSGGDSPGDAGQIDSGPGAGGAPATSADAAGLLCGQQACIHPPSESSFSNACCLAGGGCGWSMSFQVPFVYALYGVCQEFNQPGTLDSACPSIVVTVGGAFVPVATFPGCCRSDGRCGVVISEAAGCVDREEVNGSTEPCRD